MQKLFCIEFVMFYGVKSATLLRTHSNLLEWCMIYTEKIDCCCCFYLGYLLFQVFRLELLLLISMCWKMKRVHFCDCKFEKKWQTPSYWERDIQHVSSINARKNASLVGIGHICITAFFTFDCITDLQIWVTLEVTVSQVFRFRLPMKCDS